MAITFAIFHDSALTTPVDAENPLATSHAGSTSQDVQLWFGSPASDVSAQAQSDPGTDPITITPTDAASGSGQPATAVKLATSQVGLASATAGAALEIGTEVLSGTANAFSFWARLTNALTVVGTYDDLSLEVNEIVEAAV